MGALSLEDTFIDENHDAVEVSKSPSLRSKMVSEELSRLTSLHLGDFLREQNLQRVNFEADTDEKGNILIKKYYLVYESCDVKVVDKRHKILINGNKNSTKSFNRKVGAVFMSNLPVSFTLYAQEMQESVTEGWKFKLFLAAIFTAVSTWMGANLVSLIGGLVLIAIIEVLLSLIPGNVKPGTESDHTIQTKAWSLVTNILAILVSVKSKEVLKQYSTSDSIFSIVGNYFDLVVIGWIFSIYIYRTVRYVANGNKVKIPVAIKTVFDLGQRKDK
ncbi:hypothetical protein E1B06_14720 [Brevibacillus laterosporus]|uniref:hypothetical protein n=1 Tax=Brevibacillus laterosporus TaxID=1465 RepID=UPI0024049FDE|nr:hypothetical protein [Brevibacillus laterosporus]MDF9412936.1 hypothetical protein [Brevibacillus laterosporus]